MNELALFVTNLVHAKADNLKPKGDDEGALTLEQAIITGLISIACVALVAIIVAAINTAQARITGG